MPTITVPIYQVDAFSMGPFTGNPAAVCPLDEWLPDEVMQKIAAENNLSETAFFVTRSDGAFDLRWFTPTVEVDMCGHATLASGYTVMRWLQPDSGRVKFHTRSGELNVTRAEEKLALDFPSRRSEIIADEFVFEMLERVLGVRPVSVLDAGLPIAVFDSESQVEGLKPDFDLIVSEKLNWISVTAPGVDKDTDFVSRYFAPGSGIDEDPVTGSAHTWLTPYWADRLGKKELTARQVSARGGWLRCEDRGERVAIAGDVSEYLQGEISLQVE